MQVTGAVTGPQLEAMGPAAFGEATRTANVFARITPETKRRIVSALATQGEYVAMVGDGVNDVPALKAARLAIAQASGSQMARSVADVVLVSGDFASVPPMVAEGQKILRNLQRVAKLFVSKAVFAGFVVLTVGLAPVEYPFLPRHLTLVTTLTIGVPGFFLALAPSSGPWRPEAFLRDVVRFSLRAGLAIGSAVVGSYLLARKVLELPLLEARTVASTVMLVLGMYLILALEGVGLRRTAAVTILCAGLATLYVVVLSIPFTRDFFELDLPGPDGLLVIAGGAGFGLALLWMLGIRPRAQGSRA
jgi:magnesium-transporting ATPase (P-type)